MQPNLKLLLGILLLLVIIGCTPPTPVPTRKIYFDLKSDPPVLVNELGVDIVIDRRNICYSQATGLGWVPVYPPLSVVYIKRTPIFNIEDTNIRSGSSTPIFGACSAYRINAQDHTLMSAWLYQRFDKPKQRFVVYSDNVDPVNVSQYMSVTTSVLASSPFQVTFQNTSDMTISVPLNCFVRVYPSNLALAHLERQTGEGEEWEVFLIKNLMPCSDRVNEGEANEEWLDIASQMSGTVDMPRTYPADLTLEKGHYRWVTIFCDKSYTRNCYTSFSPTFDYAPEQTPQSP